ncbi:MAG: putative immunity protein [Terracidiphilus sp.]
MTDWERTLVSIAIDAAKSSIHVFEAEYPDDDRPRKALEATEKWLDEPTWDNKGLLGKLEIPLWRSKDWRNLQAALAAQACASAARAARHPLTSAMNAIMCERGAQGIDYNDYSRKWLRMVLRRYGASIERTSKTPRTS